MAKDKSTWQPPKTYSRKEWVRSTFKFYNYIDPFLFFIVYSAVPSLSWARVILSTVSSILCLPLVTDLKNSILISLSISSLQRSVPPI